MKSRTYRLPVFIAAFATTAILSISGANLRVDDKPLLRISSSTPSVDIKTRASDRRALRLPSLQYVLHIEAMCQAGHTPQSVLLSIADTRKRISAPGLQATMGGGIEMEVPSSQISPLSLEGFCLANEHAVPAHSRSVTVSGALSAQGALFCADDDNEQVTYASKALDVTLHCVIENSVPED